MRGRQREDLQQNRCRKKIAGTGAHEARPNDGDGLGVAACLVHTYRLATV